MRLVANAPGQRSPSARTLERQRLMFWLGPPLLWFFVFMIVPYGVLVYYALGSVDYLTFTPGVSGENFLKVATQDPYATVIMRSAKIGLLTALCSSVVAYPLAFYMAFHVSSARARATLYILVMLPWWASYLVKAYAWKTILGTKGILNETLLALGLIDVPMTFFLYNQFSMVLTLTYIFTPFAVLSIYAQLERVPQNVLEAARDMGASDGEIFRKIILPISVPGLLAGGVITFSLGFGDFIAAALVGGSDSVMIASIVINLMGVAYDWPLGSAIGLVIIGLAAALLSAANYLEHKTQVRL
ncbi:MAG: ABC transporter permease [Pseudomonadota bacterium]